MKFEKYQHVEKLGTPATEGILNGEVYIFPKLDGTNTSVYLNDDGEIEVASRNRVLTPEHDNAGAYVALHSQDKFKRFFAAHPNWRLYGEWLIPNVIRNYRDDAWRKFYVFDVMDENGKYIPYFDYAPILNNFWTPNDFCIEWIPLIALLTNPDTEDVMQQLENCNYLVKDDKPGEGIVIKNYDFVNKFGRTTWAKIVRAEAKLAKKTSTPPIVGRPVESDIVDAFVTPAFVEKEFAKIVTENGGTFELKLVNKFLGILWYTFVNEEMFNILRKFAHPTINFKVLHKLVVDRAKDIKADIFS